MIDYLPEPYSTHRDGPCLFSCCSFFSRSSTFSLNRRASRQSPMQRPTSLLSAMLSLSASTQLNSSSPNAPATATYSSSTSPSSASSSSSVPMAQMQSLKALNVQESVSGRRFCSSLGKVPKKVNTPKLR